MAKKTQPKTFSDLSIELDKLGAVYGSIAGRMPKSFDQHSYDALSKAWSEAMVEVQAKEAALKQVRTERVKQEAVVRRYVKAVHKLVAGTFGEDSTEYGLIGGTRESERKRPKRQPKAPAAPTPVAPQPGAANPSAPAHG